MANEIQEFFLGQNKQEIENERRRKRALIHYLPNLMGDTDQTKYVLQGKISETKNTSDCLNIDTSKKRVTENIDSKKGEPKNQLDINKRKFDFDPWRREKILDLISELKYKKLNGEMGSINIGRPEYHKDEFEYINKAKFDSVIDYSFGFEGGYSNNKYDRGGKTNYGITKVFMEQYKNALPNGKLIPIEELTREDALRLYFAMWNNKKLGYIRDKNLAFVLNDYMINSNEWKVAQRVQRILNSNGENLKTDGIFGSNTLEAIHRADKKWLIEQILIDRYNHYREIVNKDKTQFNFYKGWIKRLNKVAELAGTDLVFPEKY